VKKNILAFFSVIVTVDDLGKLYIHGFGEDNPSRLVGRKDYA